MNHKLEQLKGAILRYLGGHGYSDLTCPDINNSLNSFNSLILNPEQLSIAIERLNPHATEKLKQIVIDKLVKLKELPALTANRQLHDMLRNGVNCFYREEGIEIADNIKILDTQNGENNLLHFCHDFDRKALPGACDIVLLINGLPLVIVRVVNDDHLLCDSTLKEIMLHYKDDPCILSYNSFVIVTNATEVAIGAQFTQKEKLTIWRELNNNNPAVDKLAMTMLNPNALFDFITNFISFSRASRQLDDQTTNLNNSIGIKILATYYQYYGVNKLIRAKLNPSKSISQMEQRKLGIIGHTYGSRIIDAMLFYIGKLLREVGNINPTIICVLENIELEDRFLQFLMDNDYILDSSPIRAESSGHLKKLLNVSGGGIIVASIQKFYSDTQDVTKPFSTRKNVFVALKGHNVFNYGSRVSPAQTPKDNNFRDKFLPNAFMAGFINITNTLPDDQICYVCGDYVSRYDANAALSEGIINNVYYEKRLTKYHIKEKYLAYPREVDEVKLSNTYWQSSQSWKKLEQKLADATRLQLIAKDIVTHFEKRHSISGGKAIIAVASRKIATLLYAKIIGLRPKWESFNLDKGNIKILMTSDINDPPTWNKHRTTQQDRKLLRLRFSNLKDPLKIVIVKDMWLAGFHETYLHTIYWDKFLQGHGLMSAFSMTNSMNTRKTNGLILDYIGVEKYLRLAEKNHISNGDNTMVTIDTKQGERTLKSKMAKINKELNYIDYGLYIKSNRKEKHRIINVTRDYIFENNLMPRKIITMIEDVGRIYTTLNFKQEVIEYEPGLQFLYSFRSCLLNLEPKLIEYAEGNHDNLVDPAVVVLDNKYLYGVANIHEIQSLKNGQRLLNQLMNISNYKVRDRALYCLISIWVKLMVSKDTLLGIQLLEELRNCAVDYNVKLTPSKYKQYRASLKNLAAHIMEHSDTMKRLGISEEVYSVYSVLLKFQDSEKALSTKVLIELAESTLKEVLANRTQDWNMMENARALLRVTIKHNIRKHNYVTATENELVNTLAAQIEKILSTRQ